MDTLSIGKHNPRISEIRRAVQRGTLTSDGLLAVEGPKLVHEAHRSGLEIAALFVREDIAVNDLPRAAAVYTVEQSVFKGIQSTEHSQGVIALVQPRAWTLDEVLDRSPAPLVILAGLQDPGNAGTIIRIAESFGAAGCLGLRGTAAIHNSKVVRASAGSVFRLPCVWNLEFTSVVEMLEGRAIPLMGTSPHAEQSITAWDWTGPAAVLIGNEGAGLNAEELGACTSVLRIPHAPRVESLNSAIAAAVVLYEAYRRRNPS